MKAALTPNNIKVGFRSTGIWPLNCTAATQRMGVVASFESNINDAAGCEQGHGVTGPAGDNGTTNGQAHQAASDHNMAIGLAGFEPSTPSQTGAGFGLESGDEPAHCMGTSVHGDKLTEIELSEGEHNMVLNVSSSCQDHSNRPLHYYVDVPNAHESTYEACERNADIDPTFHTQLQ